MKVKIIEKQEKKKSKKILEKPIEQIPIDCNEEQKIEEPIPQSNQEINQEINDEELNEEDLNEEDLNEDLNDEELDEKKIEEKVEEKSEKKKRGRKPKTDKKVEPSLEEQKEEKTEEKKRGRRRKKAVIDDYKKLVPENGEKIVFSTSQFSNFFDKGEEKKKVDKIDEKIEQSSIYMGGLSITMKKKTQDTQDIRSFFDEKFDLKQEEKIPNVLSQETSNSNKDKLVIKKRVSDNVKSPQQQKNIKKIYKILNNEFFLDKNDGKLCWWCCHTFEGQPLPCPIDYDKIDNKYKVKGIFCSWECMSAFSIQNYKSLSLIYQFRKEMYTDLTIDDIKPAPDKIVLKDFGGYMTIEEFRNFHKILNHEIKISTENISYINQEILETSVSV